MLLSRTIYGQSEADFYFIDAEIQLVLGDTTGAIRNYNQASLVSEDVAQRLHCLGYSKYLQKEYGQALADYTHALLVHPDSPANSIIFFDRALTYEKLGRIQAALADYSQSVQVNATYLPGYYSLAKLYAQEQQWGLAIKNLTAVLLLDEEYAEAYLLRGRVQLEMANYVAALRDFQSTIRLDPANDEALALRQLAENQLATAGESLIQY